MHAPSPHPALGIDHGDARIGIAATDPLGILAHPVETIHIRNTDPIERIATLTTERHIRTIVIGLPITLSGNEGTAAVKVRAFAKKLTQALPDLPIEFIDESLSTVDAAEKLHAAGRNTKRQKPIIDQAAAVEILTRWLNSSPPHSSPPIPEDPIDP